jgi:hypothetical protein
MKLDFCMELPIELKEFQVANVLATHLLQKEIFNQRSLGLCTNFQINSDRFAVSRVIPFIFFKKS